MEQEKILSVSGLNVHFPVRKGGLSGEKMVARAVNGVSFDIMKGETLGLVGESGCGKTTLGRAILRLVRASKGGNILFRGQDIMALDNRRYRPLRKEMQMIFQDPFGSLNPRLTIGQMLGEVLKVHGLTKGSADTTRKVHELLGTVGLGKEAAGRYPHEFSGGQRQRVGIARALAVKPSFIICDEPVSALDVSIQSQIINLLRDLQKEFGLTYLFIAHDLSVVEYISDRVAVMYLGRIVEITNGETLYASPKHPYTQALLSAIPLPELDRKHERIVLNGDLPGPFSIPSGCSFHPRCPFAMDECRRRAPELLPLQDDPQHRVSCLLYK